MVKSLPKPHAISRGKGGGGGITFHTLNLEQLELQIHNFVLSLDLLSVFSYNTHMPSFSLTLNV